MFSQNNEEEVIVNYFGGVIGNLIDIGAYCAEDKSNTRQLILNGWSAVLIEPSPKPFQNLLDVYRDNLNITLINTAISPEPITAGLVKWYDSNGDAISTMSEAHKAIWKDVPYRMYYCPVVHINSVYSAVGNANFDFINLDVEGMNYEILLTLNLEGCRCICVEYGDKFNEVRNYLNGKGFTQTLLHNGENLIMAR